MAKRGPSRARRLASHRVASTDVHETLHAVRLVADLLAQALQYSSSRVALRDPQVKSAALRAEASIEMLYQALGKRLGDEEGRRIGDVLRLASEARRVSRATDSRRQKAASSDALPWRVEVVLARAVEVLGSRASAVKWMRASSRVLAGGRPIDLPDDDHGANSVLEILGRIYFGMTP